MTPVDVVGRLVGAQAQVASAAAQAQVASAAAQAVAACQADPRPGAVAAALAERRLDTTTSRPPGAPRSAGPPAGFLPCVVRRGQLDLNFFGALWVSQAVLPQLRA
ncbi:hypothetical protein [Micromonospora sp. NPDC050495]|uniref:hypothetical protein n=1 Tax=Micromonospora sp. NPDC050495 TaxID=3154936 RepID=UPI0033F1DC1D